MQDAPKTIWTKRTEESEQEPGQELTPDLARAEDEGFINVKEAQGYFFTKEKYNRKRSQK